MSIWRPFGSKFRENRHRYFSLFFDGNIDDVEGHIGALFDEKNEGFQASEGSFVALKRKVDGSRNPIWKRSRFVAATPFATVGAHHMEPTTEGTYGSIPVDSAPLATVGTHHC